MIKKVHIKNFKTLKDLAFPCTRMNLFIGDTNTGKTNILEALTLFSRGALDQNRFDQRLIRYERPEDLFPMKDLSEPIIIDIGSLRAKMLYSQGLFGLLIEKPVKGKPAELVTRVQMDQFGNISGGSGFQFTTTVKRYHYFPEVTFGHNAAKELEPPYGHNLPGLLASNKVLRTRLNNLLAPAGCKLEVVLGDNTVRLINTLDDDVVEALPYRNVSDTIRRYVFLYAILATVKESTLLLDEPEQNSFPFYVKHVGEMMGFDRENQYFITTHNDFLLRAIIEKTPAKELSVFICHRGPVGETRLKKLSSGELSELLDMDILFNLDRFVEA